MTSRLLTGDFSAAFSKLLEKSEVSCYDISQLTGLDQGYLSRLRNGKKDNPSLETLMKVSLAVMHRSETIDLLDIEELLNSVGRSLRIKG